MLSNVIFIFWAARFFKTRSLASEQVGLGRVLLAGQRLKPSREIHPGDRLTIERGDEVFDVYVEALSNVRGPAKVAQTLYRETPESIRAREAQKELHRFVNEPAASITQGRPTKRDARILKRFKEEYL